MKVWTLAELLVLVYVARRVGKGVYFGVLWKLYNSVATLILV